jgi:hypothetical protein
VEVFKFILIWNLPFLALLTVTVMEFQSYFMFTDICHKLIHPYFVVSVGRGKTNPQLADCNLIQFGTECIIAQIQFLENGIAYRFYVRNYAFHCPDCCLDKLKQDSLVVYIPVFPLLCHAKY